MRRVSSSALIVWVAVALTLWSCNKSVDSDAAQQTNKPVVVNTADALTFTVEARDLNFNLADSLSFTGTPVARTLVVSDYGAGTGFIIVEGSGSSVLLSDTLDSNRIIVGTEFTASVPTRIAIALTGYTGKVSFTLTRN
jgi:hypothetical protein